MKKIWLAGGLLGAATCVVALSYNPAVGQDGPPAPTGSADVSVGRGGGGPSASTGAPPAVSGSISFSGGGAPAGAGTATISSSAGGGATLVSESGDTIVLPPAGVGGGGDVQTSRPVIVTGSGGMAFFGGYAGGPSEEEQKLNAEDGALEGQVHELVQRYGDPNLDDATRGKVRAELTQALDRQFAIRQQRREMEIQQIEERVKALRSALDKRAGAKDKIIERRLSDLLSDADGLGWGESGGEFRYGFGFGGKYGGGPGRGGATYPGPGRPGAGAGYGSAGFGVAAPARVPGAPSADAAPSR